MTMPLVAIFTALHDKLAASTPLVATVGSRIYDVPPQQAAAFPMITFGSMTAMDAGTKNQKIIEYAFKIDAWSEYEGRLELMTMVGAIYDALHEIKISTEILCRCDGFYFVDESDGATRHAVVNVRVLVGF